MVWLKRIGIGLLVLVGSLVLIGYVMPTRYTVARTVVVDAPLPAVHALVADLHAWPAWEPWTRADPSVDVTVGEQATGVGATQSWTDDYGGGDLTFTAVSPEQGIAYTMLIAETYPGTGRITYEPLPAGGVAVTWAMDGDTVTPVIGGYMARVMPGMIEPMFEDGLQRLKQAAEANPNAVLEADAESDGPAPGERDDVGSPASDDGVMSSPVTE